MKLAVLFGGAVMALAAERPHLSGTWQSADAVETVAIQQTDDSVDITETVHDKPTEVHCNTSGKSCKVKGGEVTFWYSGAMLVMMESLHGASHVTEKRWTPSADGQTLQLQVLHINPSGNPEKVTLNRKSGS